MKVGVTHHTENASNTHVHQHEHNAHHIPVKDKDNHLHNELKHHVTSKVQDSSSTVKEPEKLITSSQTHDQTESKPKHPTQQRHSKVVVAHGEEDDSEIEEQLALPSHPPVKAIPPPTIDPSANPVVYMMKKKVSASNRRMLPMNRVNLTQEDKPFHVTNMAPEPSIPSKSLEDNADGMKLNSEEAVELPAIHKKSKKGPKMEVNEQLSKESSIKMMKELRARQLMRFGGGHSGDDDSDEDMANSNEDEDD
jgi:hypothetical protein